ncbi:YbaB/EbfC family nucleoid-associated protein [Actinophytocola sp.]|uniref:YbaB/EbfC family nucleoid-associated protein n=1 Tax=Actinophytocola sp. TaxID=1872138 RepID=UPI0025BD10EA|nr:YbaB/EbfC family nucleoid-associated protein [Actinophytocola sp.]
MTEGIPNNLFEGDPQDIERGLDEWVAGLERNAARYQDLADKVEDVRLSATSPNGVVTVTVDADGSLVDARFTDRIHQTLPDELSRQLLQAVAAAKELIPARVREVADDTLVEGGGPAARDSADRIVGYYKQKFPETVEPGREPERPARRPRGGDVDEFDDSSIFE